MEPTKIGIIGCGNISGIYIKNLGSGFASTTVKACADLDFERAKKRAAEYPGVVAMTVEQLLADPEIGLVINLTIPGAHYAVSRSVIEAGKSVYSEKPMTTTREDAIDLLKRARDRGVRVGNAPDTFLGGAFQTCRKVIDEGGIGTPVACVAFMLSGGPESWHPDPEFFYKAGGGPVFDMGPYYLTALVNLLGPVKRVTASARVTHPERIVGSGAKQGNRIKVDIPTHVAGSLEFAGGAIGTMVMSFDVGGGAHVPRIEIYGSEGSLSVPDPNCFGGDVLVRKGKGDWAPVELTHGYRDNHRGVGPADLVCAQRSGRAHRASGDFAYHVLDIMISLHEAAEAGRHVTLGSTCSRPAPLPVGLKDGELDL